MCARLGIALHERGDLIAVALRHAHVSQDDVGPVRLDAVDRLPAVTYRDDA